MDRLFSVVAGLADRSRRREAVSALAEALGARRAIVLVRDAELGVLIPAPGLPATIAGGRSWQEFIRSPPPPGIHELTLDIDNQAISATVLVDAHGTTFAILGGTPTRDALARFEELAPFVSGTIRAEADAAIARGEAAAARDAWRRAQELAAALDAARVQLEDALVEAARLNAELKEVDRRKDEFLAMLSHELRNPLAGITAALEVAGGGEPGRRPWDIIKRQAEQLARLLDELLDASRITQGKIVLQVEPVSVDAKIQRALDATAAARAAKDHRVAVDIPERLWAMGDRTRIEQIVTNLLTNAAKYTPPGGAVHVRVAREGASVVLAVTDDGIGIPDAMRERIFDPFVQLKPSIDRAGEGLGIGLTLVKRLVDLHGGSITVESAVGKGSTFTVRLPLADPPAEPQRDSPVAPRTVAALRVLVVDDNEDSAEMLAIVVRRWGHDVRTCHDGDRALEVAEEFSPQVVLLDIGLPVQDGYSVARELRRREQHAGVKIIAVSGYGQASDRKRSREAGFDGHLVKPIDFTVLAELLSA